MKERPILFSAPMVRALLDGTKTQTRRIAKGVATRHAHTGEPLATLNSVGPRVTCPYGKAGDRLWVREAFGHFERNDNFKPGCDVFYRADGKCLELEPWRPSIHMPRWASRILLEVTDVRVERLQDISEADAAAEGVERVGANFKDYEGDPYNNFTCARRSFQTLWDQINGAGGWEANPCVWAITFRRVEGQRP